MFPPTKNDLKRAIPRAVRRRCREILSAFDSLKEWEKLHHETDEIRMAREGWIRWTPTQLLNLPTTSPARRARNEAAIALRELEREEVP